MKTTKLLFAATLAVLGLSHFASAQTAIYLSGAPATRKIWNLAIQDLLAANSGGAGNLKEYWVGSSGTAGYAVANQTVITGGTYNSTAVTIYTDWSGSTGGNQSVAINPPASNSALKIKYLNLADLTSGTGNGGSSAYTLGTDNEQYPNINLSDTQQATIPFNGHVTITNPATNYTALTEATPNSPAVTGFEFVTNNGAPSDLTNIDSNAAQYLFTESPVPLALLTGSASDTGINVYAVGRDIASGARYATLAETGIGIANSTDLYQWEPTITSGTIQPITSANAAASGTINLISFSTGNGGYSSFTPVLSVLEAVSNNTTGYVVTYVTDSDAATAVAGGAKALTWNGVAYSPSAIELGNYTYWTYLHVFYNGSVFASGSLQANFANGLSNQLATDTNTGAILSSNVQVTRYTDGGLITPNY
jgi:hypothetical protein